MTWLWAYDKQLKAVCCSVRHSYNSFVYIWLWPILLSAIALVLAYLCKVMDTRDLGQCYAEENLALQALALRKLQLIQEGILVCIVVVGLLILY